MTVEDKKFIEGPELPRTEIEIVDNGEDFDKEEKGSIPNHDKVEIVYPKINS